MSELAESFVERVQSIDIHVSSVWPRLLDFIDALVIPLILLAVIAWVVRWLIVKFRYSAKTSFPPPNRDLADLPIESPDDDRLGFSPFAAQFADSLLAMTPDNESVVIGIVGPWGSGKTSFFNLARHHLGARADDELTIIEFQPWLFERETDLHSAFFRTLTTDLAAADSRYEDAARTIQRYARVLSDTPLPEPFAWFASLVGRVRDHETQLPELRAQVRESLRQAANPIVIVVDDIDRLDSDQTRLLLQIVRAHANFPNLIFVLLLDRLVVGDLLSQAGYRGLDYLDKIIQVQVPVPRPHGSRIEALIGPRIARLVDWDNEADELYGRWRHVYRWGISELLRTPRSVNRYVYSIQYLLPVIRPHVDIVDYLTIEALRTFEPHAYEAILSRRSTLLGESWAFLIGDRDDKERVSKTLAEISTQATEQNRESVAFILNQLFPVEAGSGRITMRPPRLASSSHFPVYFEYMIPEGLPDLAEVQRLTELASDDILSELRSTWEMENASFFALMRGLRWHAPRLSDDERHQLAQGFVALIDVLIKEGAFTGQRRDAIQESRFIAEEFLGLEGSSYPVDPERLTALLQVDETPIGSALIADVLLNDPQVAARVREPGFHIAAASAQAERLKVILWSEDVSRYHGIGSLMHLWLRLMRQGEDARAAASERMRALLQSDDLVVPISESLLRVITSDTGVRYELSEDPIVDRSWWIDRLRQLKGRGLLSDELLEALDAERRASGDPAVD
jgi:hypothetical protein